MNPTELDVKIIELFLDSSKTFIQISSSALALSYFMLAKLMSRRLVPKERRLLHVAWSSFVITILSASFYQYLGVKYLESKHNPGGFIFPLPTVFLERPGIPYVLMLFSFMLGVVFLALFAAKTLRHWKLAPEPPS